MRETTIADRERELRELLDQIEAHPEKAWTAERQRIAVLQRMLGAHEKASNWADLGWGQPKGSNRAMSRSRCNRSHDLNRSVILYI